MLILTLLPFSAMIIFDIFMLKIIILAYHVLQSSISSVFVLDDDYYIVFCYHFGLLKIKLQ